MDNFLVSKDAELAIIPVNGKNLVIANIPDFFPMQPESFGIAIIPGDLLIDLMFKANVNNN